VICCCGLLFPSYIKCMYALFFYETWVWATFWATFSQTHLWALLTLLPPLVPRGTLHL
jgi:hypothetical protein